MSEQNPYQKLEVSEDASFDDIQRARDRLVAVYESDEKNRQEVEAAYDAILMDRLRKRQEGKIKVPEGVRLAERAVDTTPKVALPPVNSSPAWLQRSLDKPNIQEIGISAGVFTVLGGLSVLSQTTDALALWLAAGVGFTVYWLNRKEQRLGRAFLLTIGALVLAGVLGAAVLQVGLPVGLLQPEALITLVVFFIFWLTSSFLR